MEMMLQGWHISRDFLKSFHGHDAHLRVLNGQRLTSMKIRLNAIEPNHVPRHLKAGDLVTPVIGVDNRLEKTHSHGKNRCKPVTLANQGLPFFDRSSDLNQLIDFDNVLLTESNGQTQLAQIATRAGKLQVIRRGDQGFFYS